MTSDEAAHRRASVVIGAGIFVSSLANTQILALPFRTLLRDRLGVDATGMSAFLGLAMFPWYLKPVVGWISDRVPLGQERRRPYLVLGALVGVLAWGLVALSPRQRTPLLLATMLANLGAVVVSTVSGALLVEAGQRFGHTSTLARVRTFVSFGAVVMAGPLSGRLAERPLAATALLAGGLMAFLAPLAWRGLRGFEVGARDVSKESAGAALKRLWAARGLWIVAAFVFLLQLSPGFQSPLFFFQTQQLGFTPSFIGVLNGVGSAAAMLIALSYHGLAKRVSLSARLWLAVVATALGSAAHLALLSRPSAWPIYVAAGTASSLCLVAVFELVARATPRGLEGLGYAVVLSLYSISNQASDVVGSWLHDAFHLGFRQLVVVNAVSTLLSLLVLPFVPRELLSAEARPT